MWQPSLFKFSVSFLLDTVRVGGITKRIDETDTSCSTRIDFIDVRELDISRRSYHNDMEVARKAPAVASLGVRKVNLMVVLIVVCQLTQISMRPFISHIFWSVVATYRPSSLIFSLQQQASVCEPWLVHCRYQ